MSPGRVALPEGMFSTMGIMPTTRCLGLSRDTAMSVAATAAAPDISPFMASMPEDCFRLMPPVSKVTPLPTRTMVLRAPLGA